MSLPTLLRLRAQALGLSDDELARATALLASLQARFRPLGALDGFSVEEIVFAHLKLARTDIAQMRFLAGTAGRNVDALKVIADLDRYRRSLRRDIELAEKRLTRSVTDRTRAAVAGNTAVERATPKAVPRVVH